MVIDEDREGKGEGGFLWILSNLFSLVRTCETLVLKVGMYIEMRGLDNNGYDRLGGEPLPYEKTSDFWESKTQFISKFKDMGEGSY